MSNREPTPILRWTTNDAPAANRFDYFAEALSSSLVPMQVAIEDEAGFYSDMTIADLGSIAVIAQSGTPHRSFRTQAEIARSGERTFHLIQNRTSSWKFEQCRPAQLAPGDAVLVDSRFVHEIEMTSAWQVVHVKLSEAWMRRWLPRHETLLGRRIRGDSDWGCALTSFLDRLSPATVARSPLPHAVFADQIGALLALVGHQIAGDGGAPRGGLRALHERVTDCIVQRCAEPSLTADDVAWSLDITADELHACLAAHGDSFGAALLSTRATIAIRMLTAPSFARLSTREIARRAGFAEPAHFNQIIRQRRGQSPAQIRRTAGVGPTR